MTSRMITMITGGARSGKSRHAQVLGGQSNGRRVFIATAEPLDDEMRDRIRKHRLQRGESFLTIEEPYEIGRAIESVPEDVEITVVDCLTVWLGNLMHRLERCDTTTSQVRRFLSVLDAPPCSIILVTNEVGMGIVPENEMARRYRDLAGQLNQMVAQKADRVVLMVSGIPLTIKGETN